MFKFPLYVGISFLKFPLLFISSNEPNDLSKSVVFGINLFTVSATSENPGNDVMAVLPAEAQKSGLVKSKLVLPSPFSSEIPPIALMFDSFLLKFSYFYGLHINKLNRYLNQSDCFYPVYTLKNETFRI